MDDDDFEALIRLVERRLGEVGAAEIADPGLYTTRDAETGEVRLLGPRKRLIEMLLAFERHMKARDLTTYDRALARINEHLREGRVEAAVVSPIPGDPRDAPIPLGEAPRLDEVREQLSRLIEQLRET